MITFAGAPKLLGDPTREKLKDLTDAQAGIVYKAPVWNKVQGDAIALQDSCQTSSARFS